jgi:hypothetical protein
MIPRVRYQASHNHPTAKRSNATPRQPHRFFKGHLREGGMCRNPEIAFFVAPGTSATVSNSEFAHENLSGVAWDSVGVAENQQTTACPAQIPGSPSYIIEANGSLQPFSCP